LEKGNTARTKAFTAKFIDLAKLQPGGIYRRSDLRKLSESIDRDLAKLVAGQVLERVGRGIYYFPKVSRFGLLPPDQGDLLKAFLQTDDFLLISPNDFNSLGVGCTQLYNHQLVINHKRNGRFVLAGLVFEFCIRAHFPKVATQEFLLEELAANLDNLSENREEVRENLRRLPGSARQ